MRPAPVGQGLKKALNKVSLEHKIKLKKRLAKAYKKSSSTELVRPGSPDPVMVGRVQEALDVASGYPADKLVTATTLEPIGSIGSTSRPARRHQTHKPDPLKEARDLQRQVEADRAAEQARRDAEVQEAQERRAAAKQARKDQYRRMTKKTRKGQPVLANQIDSLLAKIQRTA